jgi:hypothetical protein
MQTKTRFDRLPKRDREEVLRIDGLQSSRAPSPVEEAATTLRRLREHRQKLHGRTSSSLLASSLHHLKSYFCDRGIIARFLKNDVAELRTGVDTSARLGFLMRVAGGTDYSGGYDCAHVFDLILALAVDDKPLVNAFLNHFPAPFRSGHPATVLMSNGLYSVLRNDRTTFASLEQRIRDKSERNFFRAMFDCLLGIMADSGPQVEASIGDMVKWNRRQEQLNSSMQKLICLTAHGYYNVCRMVFIPRGIALPVIPDESIWDGEFQESVQTSEAGVTYFDFAPVNRLLVQWMQELPANVALEDLLAHVS